MPPLEISDYKVIIKQFLVMNCSKERPSSIVTKTLKNGSLILPIKSYEPEKICLILENRGKQPLKVIQS